MTAIASSTSSFVAVAELKTLPALSICPAVYFLAAVAILPNHPLTSPCGFLTRQTGSALLEWLRWTKWLLSWHTPNVRFRVLVALGHSSHPKHAGPILSA